MADYKVLADYIGTRTPTQVRTHLQKYLIKLEKLKSKQKAGESISPEHTTICSSDAQSSTSSHGHLTIAPHHLTGSLNLMPVDFNSSQLQLSVTSAVTDHLASNSNMNISIPGTLPQFSAQQLDTGMNGNALLQINTVGDVGIPGTGNSA